MLFPLTPRASHSHPGRPICTLLHARSCQNLSLYTSAYRPVPGPSDPKGVEVSTSLPAPHHTVEDKAASSHPYAVLAAQQQSRSAESPGTTRSVHLDAFPVRVMNPVSPPSGGRSLATSSTPTKDQKVTEYRTATNFRSVTRNDPSVTEILDTSTYSVIYEYDERAEEWVKQKQEGPLFVVRRTKSPELALFMLNRQSVKGVTIPLVPGEIKVTVVDESTLQVARRGDKTRRGIWFTEGKDGVSRFEQTIIRLCGYPSKRPDNVTGTPGPTNAATSAQAPPTDGISRLFAGLATASSPSPPPLMPISSAPTHIPFRPPTHSPSPALLPTPPSRQDATPIPFAPETISGPVFSPPPEPPLPQDPSFPPGQTVDDLLNSILGVGSPPPQPMSAPQTVTSPPMPKPNTATSTRVGDATFAQAARAFSPAMVNGSSPLNPHAMPKAPSPNTSGPYPSNATPPIAQAIVHSQPHHAPGQFAPPPHMAHVQQPMGESLLDAATAARAQGQMPPPSQLNEVGKRMFVQDLLQLIHTDQAFVDAVWRGFVARTGGPPPG